MSLRNGFLTIPRTGKVYRYCNALQVVVLAIGAVTLHIQTIIGTSLLLKPLIPLSESSASKDGK